MAVAVWVAESVYQRAVDDAQLGSKQWSCPRTVLRHLPLVSLSACTNEGTELGIPNFRRFSRIELRLPDAAGWRAARRAWTRSVFIASSAWGERGAKRAIFANGEG